MLVEVGSHWRKNGARPIGTVWSGCPVRLAMTTLGCPFRISAHATALPSGEATGWAICPSGPAAVVNGTTLVPSGAIDRRLPSSPRTISRSGVLTTGEGVVGAARYGIDVQARARNRIPAASGRAGGGDGLPGGSRWSRGMSRPYDGSQVRGS